MTKEARQVRRIEFDLPLPPSVNQLYPGKVRRHKSDKYYAWEREADVAAHAQRLVRAQWDPTDHFWRLEIKCYMADKRRDVDNTLKAGIDFIADFFALQDTRVRRILIERDWDKHEEQRWEVILEIEE